MVQDMHCKAILGQHPASLVVMGSMLWAAIMQTDDGENLAALLHESC